MHTRHSTITTEDGTVLEVKEAEVVREGESSARRPVVKVFRGGWIFALLILIIVPILIFFGLTAIALMTAGTLAVWALRATLRLFR